MARKMKKIISVVLAVVLMSMLVLPTCAVGTDLAEVAKKTGSSLGEGKYKVSVTVPGKDPDNRHDEVILMVDGSYSMDNEWPAMKKAINTIGRTVLNGSGNTMLTLMAFGMADNIVLEHIKDAAHLEAALGALPGNLLYGRSSTNCEAGFTGVAEYIAAHDATLNDVNVIFISDGNVNTDETPRAFDTEWRKFATLFGPLTVAQAAFENTVLYGSSLPDAFNIVFGDGRFEGKTAAEILEIAFGSGESKVTEEEFYTFAEMLWSDVYAYSGLVSGVEYPVSDVERAFVKYDKENGTYIQDLFYYTTYNSKYETYPDRWTRTPAAADELADMVQVQKMYVVDYDSYTAWMDTGITSDKSVFVKSNGIAGLCDALAAALMDLAKTPYNDVVVTDYMSKWVHLDPSTLQIVDNSTMTTIWSATDGWKISANRPTAAEVPVTCTLVAAENYADGGFDVEGNTSGEIYKLTWHVKDGALLRSHNYSLVYEVTMDTEEVGFEFNQQYPLNGDTIVHYKDAEGEDQLYFVDVPYGGIGVGGGPGGGDRDPIIVFPWEDEDYVPTPIIPDGPIYAEPIEPDTPVVPPVEEPKEEIPPVDPVDPVEPEIPPVEETPEVEEPKEEIPEEEIPLETPEEETEEEPPVEILEEDVPLVDIPEEEIPVEIPEVEIPEEDVPLADVPQTGDNSVIWFALTAILAAAFAALFAGKKIKA